MALAPRAALGTPSRLFSLGAESQALGKTGVSGVSDYGAVVLNPAALPDSHPAAERAAERANRITFGYDAARFAASVTSSTKGQGPEPAQPAFVGGVLGLTLPIVLAEPALTLGLALTSPRDVIVRAELPLPEVPQFPFLSSQAQALDLALGLGVRLSEHWSLGLGLRGLAGLEARVDLQSEDERSGVNSELSLDLAPVAGALFRTRNHSFGLVYRGALVAPFEVELPDQSLPGISLPPLHLDGTAHYDPAEFGVEWGGGSGWGRLAIGLVYQRWSAFPGFLGRTVKCPDSSPSCAALAAESVQLSDTWSPRFGATLYPISRFSPVNPRSALELALRLGYAFEPTPMPEQTGPANRWDNARSLFTLGYALRLSRGLGLLAAYQYHWLHARSHRKDERGSDPSHAVVEVSGNVQFFALNLELAF